MKKKKSTDFRSIKLSSFKTKKIYNLINSEYKKNNLNIKKLFNSKIEKLPDLRLNIDLTLQLENLLKDEIYSLLNDEEKKSCSLQFPFNIRASYKKINPNDEYNYSTTKLHSDVWSGAPIKSKNFIYYISINNKSSFCKIYESLRGIKKYENFRGDYSSISLNKKKLKNINYKPYSGLLISFDSLCPHKTFFPKNFGSIRLSMDFRIKLGNPYFDENKLIKKAKFIKYKPGQPGSGYYWTFTKKKFKSIKEKIKFELDTAKKISKKAHTLRQDYLKLNKLN